MNGTIDFSNGRHGNPDPHLHDDDPLEDWDESSCSDTCSSCSCSSCSTCSCCDLCDDYDDIDDISSGGRDEYQANSLPFASSGNNQMHRNGELFVPAAPPKNYKELGYQYSQPNTTQDGLTARGKMRALSLENHVGNHGQERYNFAHKHRLLSYSAMEASHQPPAQESYDDESGISMYSSGSDKETLTSRNSRHSRVCTHSRSETRAVTTSLAQKPQQRSNQKKVTFEESAFNTEGLATDSKKHKQKRCKNKDTTASDPNIDMEYKRLESILEHIDPFKLHSIMKHQLRKKHTQSVLALGRLLPKKQFSGETKHCVRCHKQYDPQFGTNACYLEHPKTTLVITHQRDNTAYVSCTICKKEYWVQQQKDFSRTNLGHCYVGKHTSSPEETVYFPHGAARSCEDRGCIEFYV